MRNNQSNSNKEQNKTIKITTYILLILFLTVISAATLLFVLKKSDVNKEIKPPMVSVIMPKKMSLNNSLYFQGFIESCVMSPVLSYVQGRILDIKKDAGDTVEKDEIIAHLEPQGFADVKASNSGVILKKFVNIGDMVDIGTPVALIGKRDQLCVYVNIPEKNVLDIKLGQNAVITHKNTDKTTSGTIDVIEPLIDVKSKTFRARILLNTTSEDLSWAYVGSAVSVEIILSEQKDAYTIPLSCLSSSSLLYYVKDNIVCVFKDSYTEDDNYINVGEKYKNKLFIIRGQSKVFPSQKVDIQLVIEDLL